MSGVDEKTQRKTTVEDDEEGVVEVEKGEKLIAKDDNQRRDHMLKHLDIGSIENAVFREKWWQLWRPRDPPPPPRQNLEDAPVSGRVP